MSEKSVIAAIGLVSKVEEIHAEIEQIEAQVFGSSLGITDNNGDMKNLLVGTPISCMLSRPANTALEVPKLLKKYCIDLIAEAKYDGERAQVYTIFLAI